MRDAGCGIGNEAREALGDMGGRNERKGIVDNDRAKGAHRH